MIQHKARSRRWMCAAIAVQLVLGAALCGGQQPETPAPDSQPPVIPVGLDAFRMWDRWAYLRIGQRTYMTSTYDRRGGSSFGGSDSGAAAAPYGGAYGSYYGTPYGLGGWPGGYGTGWPTLGYPGIGVPGVW